MTCFSLIMPWGSCYGSQRVSAPHPRPLPPASSVLKVCPDQIPMLLFTQLTLLLQPFSDRAPLPHSGCSSKSSNREQASFLSAPSAFPAHPHTYSVSSCAGSVGVLSHPCLSVHTCPSVPEPGNSVPGHTRWKMGPAIPSCSSRGRLCPLSSHSPQWVHLTINESLQPPLSCECRKAPQPSAGPLHLLCLLTGCVPTWSQGSCVSTSKIAAPLAFPTEHTSQPHIAFLYTQSVCLPLCGAKYCLLS